MNPKCSIQAVLALIVTAGFFACILFMLTHAYPSDNKDQINAALAVLATIFTLQMNYFFGSSSASKAKDEVIGEIAKAPVTQPMTILSAESVSNETKEGNINVTQKGETP